MSRHFTKTNRMVSITMHRPRRTDIRSEYAIYEDETGMEFVRMNCNWYSLELFVRDDHFEVYRY